MHTSMKVKGRPKVFKVAQGSVGNRITSQINPQFRQWITQYLYKVDSKICIAYDPKRLMHAFIYKIYNSMFPKQLNEA